MPGNVENLRKAATAKRAAATARAEKGLREVLRDGAPVTFENIAARGGVSKDFLYRNHELRSRIEQLRRQQTTNPSPARASNKETDPLREDSSSVIRTLTTKLIEEKQRHRREIAALQEELAAAHGQILMLSRQQTQPGSGEAVPFSPSLDQAR